MKFNEIWTKEINNRYRQMIKEKKSYDEIREELKDYMNYHPTKKFGSDNILSWELFKEIKFDPKYIYYRFHEEKSLQYKNEDIFDFIFEFKINDTKYILKLEYFKDPKFSYVYHISFTTQDQYDFFMKEYNRINNIRALTENDFEYLKGIYEKLTKKGDFIKIMNAIFYILPQVKNRLNNSVYMIGETDEYEKIHFYLDSIEENFKNQYDIIEGKSDFFPNQKIYYIIPK